MSCLYEAIVQLRWKGDVLGKLERSFLFLFTIVTLVLSPGGGIANWIVSVL